MLFNPTLDEDLIQRIAGKLTTSPADIRLKLVSHEDCPPEVLVALADDEDLRIKMNVASNPNTPLEILKTLDQSDSTYIRAAIARNPATPLDMLDAYAWEDDLNFSEALKNNPSASEEMRNRRAKVRRLLSHTSQVTAEEINQYLDVDYLWIKASIAEHHNTDLNVLLNLADHRSEKVTQALLRNPAIPKEVLEKLLVSHPELTEDIQLTLARSTRTGNAQLRKLAQNPTPKVMVALVRNKNLPEDILATLIEFAKPNGIDEDTKDTSQFWTIVASHPNLSKRYQEEFLETQRSLGYLARNPQLDEPFLLKILKKVMGTKRSSVAYEVLWHPSSSPKTVRDIVTQPHLYHMPWNITHHSKLDTEAITFLMGRSRGYREELKNHPNAPAGLAEKLESFEREARNSRTPERLHELAKSPYSWIQYKVLENKFTSEKTVRMLFKGQSELALNYPIAANPNTPDDILDQLFDKYPDTIAKRQNLSQDFIERLFDFIQDKVDYPASKIVEALLEHNGVTENMLRYIWENYDQYFNTWNSLLRPLPDLASHVNAPPEVLERLVSHPSPSIYINALQNPRLPYEARQRVIQSQDPDRAHVALAYDPQAKPNDLAKLLYFDTKLLSSDTKYVNFNEFDIDFALTEHLNTDTRTLEAVFERTFLRSKEVDPQRRTGNVEDLWQNLAEHPNASAELLHKLVLISQPLNDRDEIRQMFKKWEEEDIDAKMTILSMFKGTLNQQLLEIRFSVVQHPTTNDVTLMLLSEDENYSVRSEAQKRMASSD
ncbi:MAG: hypothetical protein AAF267_13100 [Deinococcota bacterium]